MSNARTPDQHRTGIRNQRPTDPFGGPPGGGNRISLIVALVAVAFFLLLQLSGGDLGNLVNSGGTPAATVTPTLAPTAEAATQADAPNDSEATPVAATTPSRTNTSAPTHTAQARGAQTPRATPPPTPNANAPPTVRASDLPTVTYADLPPEAHETIALIEAGGPFPFSRDGITFQNRERLLPRHPEGYYREYTVITPGASNRGARRIVMGEGGEMYYTDDHYESFREIVR
jgi:ribonuclease T1